MSDIRLVVREATRDFSGTIHAASADRAIAALSTEPTTLAELEAGMARFEKPRGNFRCLVSLSPGLNDEPYDAGLVVIDLAARVVVVDSTYSSPLAAGEVFYHDGMRGTELAVRYHLADDWQLSDDGENWQAVAATRRKELAANSGEVDREIFYGRPLLEFLAGEAFAAFARREQIAAEVALLRAESASAAPPDDAISAEESAEFEDEVHDYAGSYDEESAESWPGSQRGRSPFYNTLREIHAAWLLTPRADLAGRTPREVALARHKQLSWDLEDRCYQWTMQKRCPPVLERSTRAYQHGCFGTHEWVVYYDLVRELLWCCWEGLSELADNSDLPDSLTVADFLADAVPELEAIRDAWLASEDPEFHGRTPQSIIENERIRLPEAMGAGEELHDPDCPCCQMLEELPGPAFWHLDGCNMDNNFAFDYANLTHEEWEADQREFEEFNRRFAAEQKEREVLGVTGEYSPHKDPLWQSCFAVDDTADVPLGVRLFSVGCNLAEVIVRLRGTDESQPVPAETQRTVNELNRHFGNLRELLHWPEPRIAGALVEPVLDRFGDVLDGIGQQRADLAEKCTTLRRKLTKLLDPPTDHMSWEFGDEFDDDVPY